MKKLLFFIFVFGLLVAETETFSLAKTIEYAKEHSPKYQIIKREREIARAQAFQGYGAVLPNLEASYTDSTRQTPESKTGEQFAKIFGPTANVSADDIFPSRIKTKTTELKGTQLLFGFSGLAAWIAARAAEKLAEYNYLDKQEAFDLEVKKSFYDLQSAKNIKEVAMKLHEQTAKHAKDAGVMYQSNLIAKKDFLDARIGELNAKQNYDTMNKNYLLALRFFNNLIGREINQEINLATYNVQIVSTVNLNSQELVNYAYEHRPAFQAFNETLKLAQADDINAWGESLPSIYYIYSKQNNKYDVDSQTDGDTETQMISAGWRFFSGGANLHKINEKNNYKEKMKEVEKNTKNLLAIEINNNLAELEVAKQNVEIARESLDLSKESLRLAEINFQSGNGTQTQYNDALVQYQGANTNYVRTVYDYEYAKDKLNYSVGKEVL